MIIFPSYFPNLKSLSYVNITVLLLDWSYLLVFGGFVLTICILICKKLVCVHRFSSWVKFQLKFSPTLIIDVQIVFFINNIETYVLEDVFIISFIENPLCRYHRYLFLVACALGLPTSLQHTRVTLKSWTVIKDLGPTFFFISAQL